MPIIGGDTSSYKARPIKSRSDGDGKEYIYARVHETLTAKTAYLAYVSYDGYRTCALFDSGQASTTAASHLRYVSFIPDTAISSDTDGWGQCGGVATSVIFDSASTSMSTGNPCMWSDATVTGNAVGVTATTFCCNVYGICMATASSGTYDVMLLGSEHKMMGLT